MIIETNNLNEARKQIEKAKKENCETSIEILSQEDEFNRKCLEIKGVNMLIINEKLNQKDYGKQRNSGLNEVLAKICADKKIIVGIKIEEIIKKDKIEKAKALSRLRQNIMLCKKADCELRIMGNIKDKQGLRSIFLTLGANTKQAKESLKQPF